MLVALTKGGGGRGYFLVGDWCDCNWRMPYNSLVGSELQDKTEVDFINDWKCSQSLSQACEIRFMYFKWSEVNIDVSANSYCVGQ